MNPSRRISNMIYRNKFYGELPTEKIHAFLHKEFHEITDIKKAIRFIETDGGFFFHTENKPKNSELFITNEICLKEGKTYNFIFSYAALKRFNGKEVSLGVNLYDRKEKAKKEHKWGLVSALSKEERNSQNNEVIEKFTKEISKYGIEASNIKWNFYERRTISNSGHRITFPYGAITCSITCTNVENLEKLILDGVGRMKFLGCGGCMF